MTEHICTCCGKPTNGLSARMGYPDALLDYYRRHGDEHDPYKVDTMPSPFDDDRAYIRALLHIPLTGQHPEMLYCVWVEARLKDVGHAMDVWDDPREYAKVTMHGYLANSVPGYDFLGAQVCIGVREVSELPHVESARHRVLGRILAEPQPYETAVPAIGVQP